MRRATAACMYVCMYGGGAACGGGTARGGSMARGGAAQACARVVPRLVADVVVRERAQWCTLTSQLVFRSVCEWSGVFFRGSSTLGKGDN